jgi:hypothetical protein
MMGFSLTGGQVIGTPQSVVTSRRPKRISVFGHTYRRIATRTVYRAGRNPSSVMGNRHPQAACQNAC